MSMDDLLDRLFKLVLVITEHDIQSNAPVALASPRAIVLIGSVHPERLFEFLSERAGESVGNALAVLHILQVLIDNVRSDLPS